MNKEEFVNELKKININLSNEQINMFEIYCNELIEYNKHTNLTAITDKKDIYLKHFYDSLTLVFALDFTKINTLIDIGTGAGFPGLVLKILFPHLELTLLDSNNKKTKFLELLVKKLNLNNITIINDRSENYIKNKREKFDVVTARAVKNLPVLSELCIPYLKINGYFLAMKGSNEEEIKEGQETIELLNCNIDKIINLSLPKENSQRTLLRIKKIKSTPSIYPRSYEKILKKPLKKNKK